METIPSVTEESLEDDALNSENQLLPVGVCESLMTENRKERKEKKKKTRKSSIRPSVYATRQDLYLNEELLPVIDEKLNEVVTHRKYTARDIDNFEQEYYRLKLQQHLSGPVDKSELDQVKAQVQAAKMAAETSESRIRLENTLKEAQSFLASRKAQAEAKNGIRELETMRKIFG